MNLLDISILLILIYNTFIGFKSGAVRMVSSVISVFVTFYVTKALYQTAERTLYFFVPVSEDYQFIHFAILFVIIFILFQLLVTVIHNALKWSGVGFINHSLGLCLGVIRGLLFSLIIILPLSIAEAQLYQQSVVLRDSEPVINRIIIEIDENESLSDFFKQFDLDTKGIAKKARKMIQKR